MPAAPIAIEDLPLVLQRRIRMYEKMRRHVFDRARKRADKAAAAKVAADPADASLPLKVVAVLP